MTEEKTMTEVKNIDSKTLKGWLDQGEAVLVDVREGFEHAAKNIPGAHNAPLSTLSKDKLPDAGGKKMVIHCQSGKRSMSACTKLLKEAPDLEIYNLEGGIVSWGEAGHEVAEKKGFVLPLDRQVQVTVGTMVVLGSVMAYVHHPAWLLLSGFVGAGLTFAGLSGTCGLAFVLAKMPWNSGGRCTSCATGK